MSRPRKPGRATKGSRDRLVSELQAKGYKYGVARLRSSPRLTIHTGRPFEPFSGP